MAGIEEEVIRKVRMRKFAMHNLGIHSHNNQNINGCMNEKDELLNKLSSNLRDNLMEADQSKYQDGYNPLYSTKKKLGKIVVLIKKVIRKVMYIVLGWYIKPILEKQSYFNGKLLNAVNLQTNIEKVKNDNLSDIVLELQKRIGTIEKNNLVLMETIEKYKIENVSKKVEYLLSRSNVSCDISLLQANEFDYFKFENLYRGDRKGIKEIQSVYLPYFKQDSDGIVLDIGCGRGEFLELLRENNICAYGVDCYKPFVDYCKKLGCKVEEEDALTHLQKIADNSLSGIFMSQVVEHLSSDYVSALIKIAYKKLMPGSYFIMETPNPDCLAAISEFNIDMGHIKPVHYKALEFLFKESNYQSVERFHTNQCLYPIKAEHIEGDGILNIDKFNEGIDRINEMLFGYRDYTLIARK